MIVSPDWRMNWEIDSMMEGCTDKQADRQTTLPTHQPPTLREWEAFCEHFYVNIRIAGLQNTEQAKQNCKIQERQRGKSCDFNRFYKQ